MRKIDVDDHILPRALFDRMSELTKDQAALICAMPSAAPRIAGGKLKALAVTTKTRPASMPEVPTVAESGFPGFEMTTRYGLWAPANVAGRVAAEVAAAMKSPLVAQPLIPQGLVPSGSSPQEFSTPTSESNKRAISTTPRSSASNPAAPRRLQRPYHRVESEGRLPS